MSRGRYTQYMEKKQIKFPTSLKISNRKKLPGLIRRLALLEIQHSYINYTVV